MSEKDELLRQLKELVCYHCGRTFKVLKVPRTKKVFCCSACFQLELVKKGTKNAFKWKTKKTASNSEGDLED